MNLGLVYDTETTGIPDFKSPSDSPHQPHIVQLAAALVDLDYMEVRSSIDLIIKPEGWIIPAETTEVHGITTSMANDFGVKESVAINMFWQLIKAPYGTVDRIGHNISFDDRIMRIAMKRYMGEEIAETFKQGEKYCTMRSATNIVKCPPTEKMIAAGRRHYKNPSLSECYKFFFDKDLDGAHNAMVDVQATIDVYGKIQEYEAEAASMA